MNISFEVTNPDEWKKHFPPAGGDKQWKDGYSALEFARIVTGTYKENDFEEKLQTVFGKDFKILPDEIYPERLSKFDNRTGPRHHDLACCAEKDGKKIVLCIEAKVYETLDKPLDKYRVSEGKKQRSDALCQSFFDSNYKPEFGNIYFQILSSVAGTIAFANENKNMNAIPDAYFVLYQIVPENNNKESAKSKIHIDNHKNALNDFIKQTGCQGKIEESGDVVKLKEFTIPRKDKDGKRMKANISIVYIEHKVSGYKI